MPKVRPKGVIDGKQVNIPVLIITAKEGRRKLCSPDNIYFWFKRVDVKNRQIRFFITLRRNDGLYINIVKELMLYFQEKLLSLRLY